MAATHRRGLPGRNPNPFTKDEGRRLHYKGDSRYGPQTTKFPANHRPTHLAAFACCGLILFIIFVPWSTSPSSEDIKTPRLQDLKLKQSSILPTLRPAADLGFKPKLKDDEPERNPYDRPDQEEDSKVKDPYRSEDVEEEREKDKNEDSNEDPPDPLDGDEHDPEVEDAAEGKDEAETDEDAADDPEEETWDNEGDEETGHKVAQEAEELIGDNGGDEAEEEEGDKVGEEAEEATGDNGGDEAEEGTVDEVDEAEEEGGSEEGEEEKVATGDKGGDEAEEGTGYEVGDEAPEKTVDKTEEKGGDETEEEGGDVAEEEGGDETNGQTDASVGKNDALTVASDENAGEGDELAVSTDGENGILKNSTNATWVNSNSTMDGESEEEGGDEAEEEGGDEAEEEGGDEAEEEGGDEAEEEGEDETNGQTDASVGKNDASTVAADEDADEGDELAVSTDGKNGIFKNSTNATWIDSYSTMDGESEEEGGDEAGEEGGDEAEEEGGDEAEEEGEDETNDQTDASVGKNDTSTVAADEDADEGDELAVSTDGENGILKNSTNATLIDSNSTMDGESEEEGGDEAEEEGEDDTNGQTDASVGKNDTSTVAADEDADEGDELAVSTDGENVISKKFTNETWIDSNSTMDGESEEEGVDKDNDLGSSADEAEDGAAEAEDASAGDSNPVTIEPGTITNQNTSVSWSNITTDVADEKDKNSLELYVTNAMHNESDTSLHERNYTESEPTGEDSEFSGNTSEALAFSGNGTGIVEEAAVNPGESDGLVEEDHLTRSSNLSLETTMDGQANETSVTDMPEVLIDGVSVQNVSLFDDVTGEAAVVNATDSDSYSLNETTGTHELGNGDAIDGSLVEAKKPKSPGEESGLLEEDSASRESRANETFEDDGSEVNEEETGTLSNKFTISDAKRVAVDSIDRTLAANDDVDTTNSTIHTAGVISMDSSNSSTLVDSIGAADEKTIPLESGSILRVDKVRNTVATARRAPHKNTDSASVSRPNLRGASKDDVDARAN